VVFERIHPRILSFRGRCGAAAGGWMSRFRDEGGVAEEIRRTATRRGRADHGYCVLEGLRLHERALRAGAAVDAVLVGEEAAAAPGPRLARLLDLLRDGAVFHLAVAESRIEALTDGREGTLVGLVRIPRSRSVAALLAAQAAGSCPAVLLAGCDIEDPGNVGALSRTALASGAIAFAGVGITDAWHPKAVRTSMGSVFKLPVPVYPSHDRLLEELRIGGARTLGAVSDGGVPLPEVGFDHRPTAIFLGSEAFGLPESLRGELGELVSVPMASQVDSFSVNAAAAILLYEFTRQTR
jgi:TrmH family RNA methyltransferase